MLVKIYGPAPEGQRRYSPAECTGAIKHRIEGNPDPKHVSTSYAERQNLKMRMGNRRMTRLTNAFSKKAANHAHMMAIYFMHYNFVRIHQTLKVTPAWRLVSLETLGNDRHGESARRLGSVIMNARADRSQFLQKIGLGFAEDGNVVECG